MCIITMGMELISIENARPNVNDTIWRLRDHSIVRLINVHGDPTKKVSIITKVMETVRETNTPTIISGDFNEEVQLMPELGDWDVTNNYPTKTYIGDRGGYGELDAIITNMVIIE